MRNRSQERRSADSRNDSEKAKLIDELRQDLAAIERYEVEHGSFPELVRAHYEREDGSI
jgi:hypothetical protein